MGHSRTDVVAAALRVLDEQGLEFCSMRRVAAALDVDPTYEGAGFRTGGLLNPVMDACLAVGTGRARHVLVYRTVQMLGGDVVNSGNGAGGGSGRCRAVPNGLTDRRRV